MPNFRQQAEDLARQMNAAIAEARYWQLQAEQQIAEEDRQARSATESVRKRALEAAAQQRDATLASLTDMKEAGTITDADFEAKKKELLDRL